MIKLNGKEYKVDDVWEKNAFGDVTYILSGSRGGMLFFMYNEDKNTGILCRGNKIIEKRLKRIDQLEYSRV